MSLKRRSALMDSPASSSAYNSRTAAVCHVVVVVAGCFQAACVHLLQEGARLQVALHDCLCAEGACVLAGDLRQHANTVTGTLHDLWKVLRICCCGVDEDCQGRWSAAAHCTHLQGLHRLAGDQGRQARTEAVISCSRIPMVSTWAPLRLTCGCSRLGHLLGPWMFVCHSSLIGAATRAITSRFCLTSNIGAGKRGNHSCEHMNREIWVPSATCVGRIPAWTLPAGPQPDGEQQPQLLRAAPWRHQRPCCRRRSQPWRTAAGPHGGSHWQVLQGL